jgi:hypothetical protein
MVLTNKTVSTPGSVKEGSLNIPPNATVNPKDCTRSVRRKSRSSLPHDDDDDDDDDVLVLFPEL